MRGGRRPGSGAPKGNMNALKHGKYSMKVKELLEDIPGGFFILDKKAKKLRFIYKEEQEL